MRKFNLELVRSGALVTTKSGIPVSIIDYNANATECGKLVGWAGDVLLTWSDTGKHRTSKDSELDLILVGKDAYYINIFKDDEGMWAAEHMYEDKETAMAMGEDVPYFYDTIKISI